MVTDPTLGPRSSTAKRQRGRMGGLVHELSISSTERYPRVRSAADPDYGNPLPSAMTAPTSSP